MASMLQGISNDNFVEYLNSIERCINGIGSINYILSSYKLIRDKPEDGIRLLVGQLSGISKNIELEISYKLFCECIGAEFTENGKQVDQIPLFPLLNAVNEETIASYPWQKIEDNNFLIYENDIEESFYSDIDGTKNKQVKDPKKHDFQYEFDKKLLSIINAMRQYPRSREILNLYETFLLMKEISTKKELLDIFKSNWSSSPSSEEMYFGFSGETLEKAEKDGKRIFHANDFKSPFLNKDSSINVEEYKKRFNEYQKTPERLFFQHFDSIMKKLQSEGAINFKLDLLDNNWIILQNKLREFGKQLLIIQESYKSTIKDITSFNKTESIEEKDLELLCKDVHAFFVQRDMTGFFNENGEESFPTAREISNSRPGGAGILKRINKNGGLTAFKKDYFAYVKKLKNTDYLKFINDTLQELTSKLNDEQLQTLRDNLVTDINFETPEYKNFDEDLKTFFKNEPVSFEKKSLKKN